METGCTITGETDMGGNPIRKKTNRTSYKSWVVLAVGLFITSLIGGFTGSWLNKPIGTDLIAKKLVPVIDILITKVEKIKPDNRTDEILLAISKLDAKLDVVPDLIAKKIEIPPCPSQDCPKEEKIPCEQECPDNSIHPFYVPDNHIYCPGNSCTIEIPTQAESKPDTAVRVICINRYGPTQCMPSLDKAVVVTRGYIKECLLVNSNLKCEREKRLR